MLLDNSFFYPGNVIYNTFNIDFDRPFIEQLDELNEDLVQVEYKENYLLDIGWYPECETKGKIIVQLIHNSQWEKPVLRKECITQELFLKNLLEITEMMKK